MRFLEALNPTLNFLPGNISSIPFPKSFGTHTDQSLVNIAKEATRVAQSDWDNFETSWDFRDQPLLRPGLKGTTLGASWQAWKTQCDDAIRRMQELETENNQLFIEAYGLQDELKPDVPEEQITLARADAQTDMAAFVSYAVGCMFGRYSLDRPGLILADAGSTVADYYRILGEGATGRGGDGASVKITPSPARPLAPSFSTPDSDGKGRWGDEKTVATLAHSPTHQVPPSFLSTALFEPDADGILPVLDGDWFADDIVGRFREFLRVTFGADKLEENLAFVETALGKDLRKYFVRDFYKNHLSSERAYGYKKRPIYWMFSSPEGSFQALIYLHRYTRDTVNLLLNDYLREFMHKLEERQRLLTATSQNEGARAGDRAKALKELGRIEKMRKELAAWEREVVLPLAQQRIEIDLGDGVKVNYLKFKGALVPIPGLEKKEEE
jgi:hypothetical protein